MDPNESSLRCIRFDRFEVDLRSGELRKNGHRVRLQDQPFQLLALLLEHPGEVVARLEICRRLWQADTFVDFDHSMATAINKVREALGDSAEHPQFIETLPRRGYRFIGEITSAVQTQTQPPIPAEAVRRDGIRPAWRTLAISMVVLACAAAAVIAFRSTLAKAPPAQALTILQFTALPGIETAPAFSPDGSRIAFAWNGDPALGAKGFDLYVKAIGSETLLRLTHHPSDWIAAAWSPDGTQIAFHRLAGADTGMYVVPALGGPERQLRLTHVPYSIAAPISWSADGKWIAFGDSVPNEMATDRNFLLSVETLEVVPITHNPTCKNEGLPTFFHQREELAYLCVHSTNDFELYSVAPFGGTPKAIAAFSDIPEGIAWSGDDHTLVISQFFGLGAELDEVGLVDGALRRIDLRQNPAWPAISPKGDKLAFSASFGRGRILRKDLRRPETPSTELAISTQDQSEAQYSPDGKHIAFRSSRTGSPEIWMADAEGENLVQLSRGNGAASTPRWSPDGKKIAFDSRRRDQMEIYVVDVSGQVPRRLVSNVQKMVSPSWSRNGEWIYFQTFEAKGQAIYRCPASGGDATIIGARPDGINPQESFDGSILYFAERYTNARLRSLSLHKEFADADVDGLPTLRYGDLWALIPQGIYFVPADAPKSVHFFDFATKNSRRLFEIDKDFGMGFSLSPDKHWILYSQIEEQNDDIMIAEHFR
jgi:Tol biopolymer transport system component/DNA-binding winged helix-turn-helix (wHTH) protein